MPKAKSAHRVLVYLFLTLIFLIKSTFAYADTYEISTPSQLLAIKDAPNDDYLITTDINLEGVDVSPSNMYITETFKGTLDGQGFKITNINKPLFSSINGNSSDDKAIIKNLNLVTSSEGLSGKGILVSDIHSYTTIENVNVEGKILSNTYGNYQVGGLAGTVALGWDTDSSILNSSSSVSIDGIENIGGLVGELGPGATISESFANGTISGQESIGGLVGLNYGTIVESHANGSVIGQNKIGGLVGSFINGSNIYNSYSSGAVSGNSEIGGLVGLFMYGTIHNSFSTGTVTGDQFVGGLVGNAQGIAGIRNSIATGAVTGRINVSNLTGYNTNYGSHLDSYGYGAVTIDGVTDETVLGSPGILSIINKIEEAYGNKFEIDDCFNKGLPYLSSLKSKLSSSCSSPIENRVKNVNFRVLIETKKVEKALSPIGFNLLGKESNLDFKFSEPDEDLQNKVINFAEIALHKNIQIDLSQGEQLQIKIKSGSEKQMQIWTRLADGRLVLVGILKFDKNGEALLPAIDFNSMGNFEILLTKDSDDIDSTSVESQSISKLLINVSK